MKSRPLNFFVLVALMLFAVALVTRAQPAAPATAPASTPTGKPALRDIDPAVAAFMKPVEVADGDDDLLKKQKERHNTAVRLLEHRMAAYRQGLADMTAILDAAKDVADAGRDLARTPEEQEAAARRVVDVMRAAEKRIEEPYKAGMGSETNVLRARLARETAEVELLKIEKARGAGPATRPGK